MKLHFGLPHRLIPFWAGALIAASSGCDSGNSSPRGSGEVDPPAMESRLPVSVSISDADPLAVSPLFFGQNYWSWVPAWGDPVAAIQDQTARAGLGLLRAGGANNDRQEPEPFSFEQVDEFVEFARAIGAEPLLQVPLVQNLEGEPATAEDAAALVETVNRTEGHGVRYFSIGNEPDLYTEQGLEETDYDAAAFCESFAEFAAAMRQVDPDIVLVGPDLSWKYTTGNSDWLTPFLEGCGDLVDIVAVHRYPLSPTACTEAAAYGDADRFRSTIGHVRSLMEATGHGDKPLAITEANITWDGEPASSTMPASPGTFPAALWLADNLGVALEAGLENVSYWSLSEGWTLGFFDGTAPRPAFHVLELFATRFGSEVLKVDGAPDGVSVYAGRGNATLAVFVVNKTESTLELELAFELEGAPTAWQGEAGPISLLVVELGEDEVPRVTEYSAEMSQPLERE